MVETNIAASTPGRRSQRACSHCSGSGREPAPLILEISRSGDKRGELTRIAGESGIDRSNVSRTLAGQSVPSLVTIVLLARALGVSESRLIHFPPIWHRLCQELAD